MKISNDFYVARNMFTEYTRYTRPLSYEEWIDIPDNHKAAVLYVQFFDQVTLAWYKLKSTYSVEADGVDEALQYLQKNVEKIRNDKKRFTPAYIYRVMYNCLYCLCRDPNRYKRVYENECSNIVMHGADELDLFDTVVDSSSDICNQYARQSMREAFWNVIENTGLETKQVVAKLLGEDVDVEDGGWCYTGKEYQEKLHQSWKISDPKERKKFMDRKGPKGHRVISGDEADSINPERLEEILEELRVKLAPFREFFDI